MKASATSISIGLAFFLAYKRNTKGACWAQAEFPYFETACFYSPKFEKRNRNGEDSHLVSSDKKLIMVADGVGGWNDHGVDPGIFSRRLTSNVSDLYEKSPETPLVDTLTEAVDQNPHRGSSTAVMARLTSDNRVDTCNHGDSAYLIVRPKRGFKTIYRSKEQTYSFDFPYQCGTYCKKPSEEAFSTQHKVQHNDIIVMGSDGVFDNLFDKDIKRCLRKHRGNLENQASCIATYAEFTGYQDQAHSPYTQSALDHGLPKEKHLGGKADDITVIVAQVKLRH